MRMTEVEVMKIRYLYFEYFCQLLKEFPLGLNKNAKNQSRKQGAVATQQDPPPLQRSSSLFTTSSKSVSDVDKVFNKQNFLMAYEAVTNQAEQNCLTFLERLVKSGPFNTLIRNYNERSSQQFIHLFKSRLDQINKNSNLIVDPIGK